MADLQGGGFEGYFACQFENYYGPAFSRTLTPPPPPLQKFLDPPLGCASFSLIGIGNNIIGNW